MDRTVEVDDRHNRRVATVWLTLAATSLGLLLSYVLKDQCATHPWVDSFQYRRLCYNDIQPLYGVRGVEKGLLPYIDVRYEYPPLTGVFMDLSGRLLRWLRDLGVFEQAGNPEYFRLSSLLLAPFGIATALMLRPLVTRERLLLWSIGTPIILYSFHNWDLIVVAAAVWGLARLERGKFGEAGLAMATGASAKLFPVFLLPAALLERISKADRKSAVRMIVASVIAFAIINAPFIVLARGIPPILNNPNWPELTQGVEIRSPTDNGWLEIWKFHADRYPDFGTVWFWVAHHGRALVDSDDWRAFWRVPAAGQSAVFRDLVGWLGFVVMGVGSLLLLYRGWGRRLEPQGYPVASVSLAILCLFLLVSKVHSPQYALWVVPFLVLLDIPWRYALAYLLADLVVYVSGFYWFTVFDSPAPAWKGIFEVMVLARAVTLGYLMVAATKASRLLPFQLAAQPDQNEDDQISSRPV